MQSIWVVTFQHLSSHSMALTIGWSLYNGNDWGTQLGTLFTLRLSRWITPLSRTSSAPGGRNSCHQKGPKCTSSNKSSNSSKPTSNTGITLLLEIFSRHSRTLTRKCELSSNKSSLKVIWKDQWSRKSSYKLNWRKDQGRRKFFGGRNLEFDGWRRAKEIPNSFIGPPFKDECTTQ